jgi:hypothetical protein
MFNGSARVPEHPRSVKVVVDSSVVRIAHCMKNNSTLESVSSGASVEPGTLYKRDFAMDFRVLIVVFLEMDKIS